MNPKASLQKRLGWLHRYGRNTILLSALTGLVIIYPSIESKKAGDWVAFAFSLIVVLGALALFSDRPRKTLIVTLALGLPMVALGWLPILQYHELQLLAAAFNIAFFGYLIRQATGRVLSAPKVTSDVVAGAIAVYMLIGILWTAIYVFVYGLNPDSFAFSHQVDGKALLSRPDFLYYSFVTLSTLGYGDIVPVSGAARSMATMEAMTGVVYMAVFVGRIVSLHKPMDSDHQVPTKKGKHEETP